MMSVARRLKINWHKSRIGGATYGRTAQLRMRGQRLSLKRATGGISQIPYRSERNRRVYEALKKSASFLSNRFSRRILVAIVDAGFRTKIGRALRSFNKRGRFFRNLQNQLRRRGVKLFVATVGLTASQVRGINYHLRAIAGHQKGRVFLFPVSSFRKLVTRASFVARRISEETRCMQVFMLPWQHLKEKFSNKAIIWLHLNPDSHLSERYKHREPRVWTDETCAMLSSPVSSSLHFYITGSLEAKKGRAHVQCYWNFECLFLSLFMLP